MSDLSCNVTSSEFRKKREKTGMTMAEAATFFKSPLSTWKSWEYGKRRVPGVVLKSLELYNELHDIVEEPPAPLSFRDLRSRTGLSMAEAARTFLTPYRTWQDWERGEVRVPGIAIKALELYRD
jgi:DNA-binding transcriptional regulator YiaG